MYRTIINTPTEKRISSSKVTCPVLSGIFERDRLFRRLDAGRTKDVVWVSGPAGLCKTTIMAGYLDSRNLPASGMSWTKGTRTSQPSFIYYMGLAAHNDSAGAGKNLPLFTFEYLQGIGTFTRRYFENLCQRFSSPFLIVLDSYQEVPVDSGFHNMLVSGLAVIPAGFKVVIISRNGPPRQFARLRANNRIDFIGWNEIRFTPEECRQVVGLYGKGDLTDETFDQLYGNLLPIRYRSNTTIGAAMKKVQKSV